MEAGFDKEIDALLRRESGGRTITIGEFAGGHPDADEIAAFVERVLPDQTRNLLIGHFAECDPCREVLSNAIMLNPGDLAAPEEIAVAVPIIALPWYRRLFQFPQLAYGLGGLVVMFAGFISISVIFNSEQAGVFEMSKAVSNQADAPSQQEMFANTNAASNAQSAHANTTANAAALPSEPMITANETMPAAANTANSNTSTGRSPALAEADSLRQRAESRPTVQPVDKEDRAVADEKPADVIAREDRSAMPARDNEAKVESLRTTPGATPPPAPPKAVTMASNTARAKKADDDGPDLKKSAPSGASTLSADRKQVKGKTFELRQGAWYDTTYRGQGTINIRRNTANYRKLDGGLRSIAESFIGTVVTVWNGKAYRID